MAGWYRSPPGNAGTVPHTLTDMTARKPPGLSWESWIDQKIREGQAGGMFDNLPGAGERIDGIDLPRDEDWWIKEKLKREEISYLPPTLAIRKDVEDTKAAIRAARSERQVRALIEDINTRIRHVNARGADGPPSTVMPLDVEATVAVWAASQPSTPAEPDVPAPGSSATPQRRPRRWRRWFRRRARLQP